MSLTVDAALRAATQRLVQSDVPGAARDARVLLAHVCAVAPTRISLMGPDPLDPAMSRAFNALIDRRAAREPVSHLVGSRMFFGRDFRVSPAVLDPRPETECLIEEALALPWTNVLDLGTGSGAILLTLLAERPDATGTGIDASPEALAVAHQTARDLAVSERADLRLGDWADGLATRFDLVTCNPPYISADDYAQLEPEPRLYEPRMALTPGGDGLACYQQVAGQLSGIVTPGGFVLFEIGPTQGPAVVAILAGAGFSGAEVLPDLDGRARVVKVQSPM